MTTGTIVHLGAGRCQELPEYLAAAPARIILVEPDPDQARDLARRARSEQGVTVVPAAVASAAGMARLRRFRLRDLNSLRKPTGIYALYPGLRLEDEIEVETLSPRALLEGHQLGPDEGNRLVLDTPGEEAAIVRAFLETDDLTAFDRIDLHCGARTLYEGNDDATAVLRLLEQAGYEIEACDDSTDPDRPRWTLRRDALKLENRELRDRLAETVAVRDELAQGLRKSAEQQKQDIAELIRARDEQARLAAERATQITRVTAEMEQTARQAAQRQEQFEMEKGRFLEERTASKEQFAEAIRARDELARQLSESLAEIGRLKVAGDEFRRRAKEGMREIAELTRELDVQTRLVRTQKDNLEQRAKEQDEAVKQLADMTAGRDRATHELSERLVVLEQVQMARDELQRLSEAGEKQIAHLIREMNEQAHLAAERAAKIAQLSAAREEQAKQISAQQARIEELESKVSELIEVESKQALLIEEIARAEGQLDLIKDLLLHESGR